MKIKHKETFSQYGDADCGIPSHWVVQYYVENDVLVTVLTKNDVFVTELTMPLDLKRDIEDIAAAENRSLNGQIVQILQDTVEAYKFINKNDKRAK